MESKFRLREINFCEWIVEERVRTFFGSKWKPFLKYRGSNDAFPYPSKERALKRLLHEIKLEIIEKCLKEEV